MFNCDLAFDLAGKAGTVSAGKVFRARLLAVLRGADVAANAAAAFWVKSSRSHCQWHLLGVLHVGHQNAAGAGIQDRVDCVGINTGHANKRLRRGEGERAHVIVDARNVGRAVFHVDDDEVKS